MKRLLISIAVLGIVTAARADDDAGSRAKAEFIRGTDLVRHAQWAEAHDAFQQADHLRAHPVTSYNMGVCERAMGQYVRARKTFLRALAQNQQEGGAQLSPALRDDTQALIADIDRLLATITVTIDPPNAAITFDGRPLEREGSEGIPVMVAGVLPPGTGDRPPAATFRVHADPGAHVIAITRKGYSDAIFNRALLPGSTSELVVRLDTLPATLHIASQPDGAAVIVSGTDVGLTPVDVLRPAGVYPVVVKKSGFLSYEVQVTAHAGENVTVRPTLPLEKRSIATRWWFWGALVVIVGGAVVGTALAVTAVQPKTRPPVFAGGLGWSVPAQ